MPVGASDRSTRRTVVESRESVTPLPWLTRGSNDSAKGSTTGEISTHFAEIYGASESKETVSRITD